MMGHRHEFSVPVAPFGPTWFQALTHTAFVVRQRKKLGFAGAFAFGFHNY